MMVRARMFRGYNLTFQSLAEFEVWRQQEEDMHTIEFVRGDSHGSRSNPPRFKEHVKLVCARHSRRGRKQYVKKYPERVRKLPNRKIHGIGCPASICYKTYVNTSIVRVMYRREHSHPTGPENLVFTKRGRRILSQRNSSAPRTLITPSPSPSSGEFSSPNAPQFAFPSSSQTSLSDTTSSQEFTCSTSLVHGIRPENMGYDQAHGQLLLERPFPHSHEPQISYIEECNDEEPIYQPSLYSYDSALAFDLPSEEPPAHTTYARWDRLAALFRSVHERALSFEDPQESLDILEEVLVKLYLGNNLMGEPLPNNRENLGSNTMGRNPMQATRANHSRELIHPVPVRNTCISTPELFGESGKTISTPTPASGFRKPPRPHRQPTFDV
ncbi:unnamed protein product [Rhizoctonia solani]|uniref:Uncharacterized protein n=1 Tax=Rhizoctonia solani TaxID=456999 RepID=A0A8H3H439_9AGAM|nr:unnamed protein product [Rhizoctonia solani]